MSDYGLKVTKAGASITSTNPMDYLFNSKFGSVIIYKEAIVSVTLSANATVKSTINYTMPDGTTPLNFGYVPIVMLFVELTAGSNKWYLSPFTMLQGGDPGETYIILDGATDTAVEADKFFITFKNKIGSSRTIRYHYYIFANLG